MASSLVSSVHLVGVVVQMCPCLQEGHSSQIVDTWPPTSETGFHSSQSACSDDIRRSDGIINLKTFQLIKLLVINENGLLVVPHSLALAEETDSRGSPLALGRRFPQGVPESGISLSCFLDCINHKLIQLNTRNCQ